MFLIAQIADTLAPLWIASGVIAGVLAVRLARGRKKTDSRDAKE
ncbi:MAG TPA: hypothetical protein PL033_09615 [Candidatus Brocadiia bacterium]|nr:hypothetical protein [Candidatus Brocadiia bacterium]